VPVPRFWARKKIAAEPAKEEVFRVPLRSLTVPGETLPSSESGLGAHDAFQHADDPARALFWRGHEEEFLPLAESLWDPEPVLLRILPLPVRGGVVDNVQLPHRVACESQIYTLLTPLDPGQLSLRSSPHQCLLDTWSRQELVVNFRRDRGREHPRSASHRLGFTINSCRGPVSGLLAGLTCGPRRLQDPVPPPLLLDPPCRAACALVTFLGLCGCRHVCSGRYCLAGAQFYQAKGRCVDVGRPPTIVRASDGGRVTPIGGNQAEEHAHNMVLKFPAELKAGALGLIAVPSLTVYEGANMPGLNNQADSAW